MPPPGHTLQPMTCWSACASLLHCMSTPAHTLTAPGAQERRPHRPHLTPPADPAPVRGGAPPACPPSLLCVHQVRTVSSPLQLASLLPSGLSRQGVQGGVARGQPEGRHVAPLGEGAACPGVLCLGGLGHASDKGQRLALEGAGGPPGRVQAPPTVTPLSEEGGARPTGHARDCPAPPTESERKRHPNPMSSPALTLSVTP